MLDYATICIFSLIDQDYLFLKKFLEIQEGDLQFLASKKSSRGSMVHMVVATRSCKRETS
jgi:hypothetical protein